MESPLLGNWQGVGLFSVIAVGLFSIDKHKSTLRQGDLDALVVLLGVGTCSTRFAPVQARPVGKV